MPSHHEEDDEELLHEKAHLQTKKTREISGPQQEKKYNYESDSDISVRSKKSSSSSSSDENRSWQQDPTILQNNAFLGRHTSFFGITGGSGPNLAARTMRYLHIALFTVLPITEHISTWYHKQGTNKSLKNFTVASVAADMTTHRPGLVEAILDVTHARGSMARDKLMLAYEMMQADGQSHPMAIMAFMAFFWTNDEKSKVHKQFRSILHDFALAKTPATINRLLQACAQGQTLNLTCTDTMIDVDSLPGVARLTLTPQMTRQEFDTVADNWRKLWQCMCNFVCGDDFKQVHLSYLDERLREFDITRGGYATSDEIQNHPYCKHKEIHALISDIQIDFLTIDSHARSEGQQSRIPSGNFRKKMLALILDTSHQPIWHRMVDMMDREGIDIDSMSYDEFVIFTLRADRQNSTKSTIVAFVRSMKMPSKPTDKEKDHDKPRVKDKDKDKDKEKESERQYPVYINQPSGSIKGSSIYEALVGFGVKATESERQHAITLGKCSNCFNVKSMKYPTHTAQECPYTTPSCLPRTDGKHIPIARINGFTDRASDPAVVDAFIKERTAYLIDLHSNPRGKESNNGKSEFLATRKAPTIPPEPQRNVTFQPVQLEKITDADLEDPDESAISIPPEPPAKGTLRAPTWHTSPGRNLHTHFMMFNIHQCLMVSPNANYRLLHWGD